MTELTRIEELEIHGGKWNWGEFMGMSCGLALTAGFLGSAGLLGVALLAGAVLVAVDR